ncbi:TetR/AcrR family transcriptional regulator [Amycolatopsis sp. FDAARGOS 1241]|uniref:TetR/AcrR family transcriptional regulator n=1 Tax=Amycolatopsis sp. FDAARGOS 1241 TaxID=2778070 RepID=UPI0019525E92|nr:TetR/AcrR family transcriptional regulator [Amycolatopsis sp. FDAARGOS 1241]QRP49534.1 TetR/AcrR family transcriptional regulator [Amycolatopsis sp. FDAARGOS 1241]
MATPEKRQRADARRNYDVLLAAAKDVFARLGTDAPLEFVAQEAGVGRGTLYRHFPSREHVFAAIMRDSADALDAHARELLDAPDGGARLPEWLRHFDRAATEYPGLTGHVTDDGSPVAVTCAPMKASFKRLLARARDEGRVRPDVSAAQVLTLVGALPKDPETGRTAKPYLDVVLEGLRITT